MFTKVAPYKSGDFAILFHVKKKSTDIIEIDVFRNYIRFISNHCRYLELAQSTRLSSFEEVGVISIREIRRVSLLGRFNCD